MAYIWYVFSLLQLIMLPSSIDMIRCNKVSILIQESLRFEFPRFIPVTWIMMKSECVNPDLLSESNLFLIVDSRKKLLIDIVFPWQAHFCIKIMDDNLITWVPFGIVYPPSVVSSIAAWGTNAGTWLMYLSSSYNVWNMKPQRSKSSDFNWISILAGLLNIIKIFFCKN